MVTTGGRTEASTDGTLTITEADGVLLLVDIRLPMDAAISEQEALKSKLAGIPTDFDAFLRSHAALHGALFNRMRSILAAAPTTGSPLKS